MIRRTPFGLLALALLFLFTLSACASKQAPDTTVVVYKTPTCGCCGKWVEHLQKAGFTVTVHDMNDLSYIKSNNGVDGRIASCHTALVDGYVIEGHVPAEQIRRLLTERPDVTGLAVPGMPIGSPGMEVESGRVDPYDVLAFDRTGQTSVFAHVE